MPTNLQSIINARLIARDRERAFAKISCTYMYTYACVKFYTDTILIRKKNKKCKMYHQVDQMISSFSLFGFRIGNV